MSGLLDLTFSHQDDLEVSELPVVVDVADSNLEQAVPPGAVRIGRGWRRKLSPGTYLARVHFPSGHVTRQTCTVYEGKRTVVYIDVDAVPGYRNLEWPTALRPLGLNRSTPGLSSAWFESTWVRRWHRNDYGQWALTEFDGSDRGRDDRRVRYQFQPDQTSQLLQFGGPSISWRFVTIPPNAQVDVTVSPRGKSDLDIEVTTQSTDAEALLGYLRSGAVDAAEAMADSLLRRKLDDPFVATITGYYLLRVADLKRLSAMAASHPARFLVFPDGAVIAAWRHLHAGRRDRGHADLHFGRAREELLRAARLGIPVYTEGLKLLLDGLRLMDTDANGNDPELVGALEFIEPFALAADSSSTTVTYGGQHPAEPSSVSYTGIPEQQREELVLLQQVRLQDLVEFGWLYPGSLLVSSERPGNALATVTASGELDVVGKGIFDTPGAAAQAALGLELPDDGWLDWQLTSGAELTPRAAAAAVWLDLVEQPTLNDLRWAAHVGIPPEPSRAQKNMNTAELIDAVAEKSGTDRRQATAAVEYVVDTIVRAVHKGDSVAIAGFGVFEQRRRAARVARNPRTGETVRLKPTSVPAFRPGAQFKALVSGEESLPAEGPAGKRATRARGAKKTPAKKAVKQAPAKKAVKQAPAKKAAAKKVVKQAPAKKAVKQAPAKKAAAKKVVKQAPVRKAAAKKVVKEAPVRKAAAKRSVKGGPARRAARGRM